MHLKNKGGKRDCLDKKSDELKIARTSKELPNVSGRA